MALARNEDNALRCIYHGWKFSVEGVTVAVPTQPNNEAEYCKHVPLKHYPVREEAGVVWVWLGEGDTPPAFQNFSFTGLQPHQVLDTALDMLHEEGLENVYARHDRFAEAARRAVRHWGMEIQCAEPRHYSSVLTAVRLPEGHSANALRATILERFNMSLGNGLGPLNDRVFRIGHLGDFGPLSLVGTLGGVEMGLRAAGVPHQEGGVLKAMEFLNGNG